MSNKPTRPYSPIAPLRIRGVPSKKSLDSGSTLSLPFNTVRPGIPQVFGMQSVLYASATKQIERQLSNLKNPTSPALLRLSANQTLEEPDKTLEERLFDATANVKILTSQVAMHLDREWRNKLFGQLDSLHDLEEWDHDDVPIQEGSFATFLKAIVQIKPERRPGLGLSHNGHLIAAWTADQDRLTIEFFQNDKVRWVLTRRIGVETERFAGQTSVSRLVQGLAPYNSGRWFYK